MKRFQPEEWARRKLCVFAQRKNEVVEEYQKQATISAKIRFTSWGKMTHTKQIQTRKKTERENEKNMQWSMMLVRIEETIHETIVNERKYTAWLETDLDLQATHEWNNNDIHRNLTSFDIHFISFAMHSVFILFSFRFPFYMVCFSIQFALCVWLLQFLFTKPITTTKFLIASFYGKQIAFSRNSIRFEICFIYWHALYTLVAYSTCSYELWWKDLNQL